MLVLPLIAVLLVWYVIICWKWKKNIFDVVEKMPGLKWYPIIGTFLEFQGKSRQDILYKFADVSVKNGPFYRSWHGGSEPEVHLMKPEHLQTVLRSSAHITKGPFYDYLFPWLGEGIFISEGAKWFFQRKLVTPMFHFKILESFIDCFSTKTIHLLEVLDAKADGQYFNIVDDVSKCTLKIFFDTAVGVPLEDVTDSPLDHVKNVHEITEMVMWRYWRPHIKDPIFHLLPQGRHYRKVLNGLHQFGDKVIAYKKELRERAKLQTEDVQSTDAVAKPKNNSFLDQIMDATVTDRDKMSDSDLKSILDTFLLAGYETTANTASWALFLLGNHPDIQEKLYQEIQEVLKGRDAPSSMADLNELKYLECVIKETLRMYPVLPFITRRTTEDVKIDGYTVPANTQALIHILLAQKDPEHWPEPNRFDPERFTPENSKGRHPFAFIPFSAGPRNCLGMRFALLELKAVLSTIINRYKVTSLNKEEEVKLFAHVVLRPQCGINVKLEIRD